MKLKDILTESPAKPVVKPALKLPKEETAVTMDMPLFIRALEFAREDARADVDLHKFAENAEILMKKSNMLSMKDYKKLMKGVKTKKDDEEE